MLHRASQILNCLLDAPVITVEPGFAVAKRASYGIHGEWDDLALSVEWSDADGCLWAAEFSEESLEAAELQNGTILIHDTEGTKVAFQLYQPEETIELSLN